MQIQQIMKNSVYALKIVFTYAPWVSGVYTLLSIMGAAFTALQVLFLARLVDAVMSYASGGLLNPVALWASFYVSSLLLAQIYTISLGKLGRFLNRRLTKALSPVIIDKFGRIEYRYFESSMFRDVMSRMTANPQQMIHNTFFSVVTCLNSVLKLIGILGVFFAASLWAGLGVFIIGIPMTVLELRAIDRKQTLQRENTPDKRRAHYLQGVFSNKHAAYEMKIFNSKNYMLSLWMSLNKKIVKSQKKLRYLL